MNNWHKYYTTWVKPASCQNRIFLEILLLREGVWKSFVSFYEFEAKIYFNFAKTQVWGKNKKNYFLTSKEGNIILIQYFQIQLTF